MNLLLYTTNVSLSLLTHSLQYNLKLSCNIYSNRVKQNRSIKNSLSFKEEIPNVTRNSSGYECKRIEEESSPHSSSPYKGIGSAQRKLNIRKDSNLSSAFDSITNFTEEESYFDHILDSKPEERTPVSAPSDPHHVDVMITSSPLSNTPIQTTPSTERVKIERSKKKRVGT